MRRPAFFTTLVLTAMLCALTALPAGAKPEGTLTVAVATFGNERWLPHLYVGAEDIVLKPLWENLLGRDAKGNLTPMLAEKWEVLDGARTWKFHLRKGGALPQWHGGHGRRRQVHLRLDRTRGIGELADHGVPADQEHGDRGPLHDLDPLRQAVRDVR